MLGPLSGASAEARDRVVGDPRPAVEKVAVVLVVVDGGLDVVAGEGCDCLRRIPKSHDDELGPVLEVAPQDLNTTVARSGPVVGHARLLEVAGIGVAVRCGDRAAPHASN